MKIEKGFTLMELTIVLAILAIIAAILIPAFLMTTDRSRLRGDIQSARVIQNAMDLYRVERGRSAIQNEDNMEVVVDRLVIAGYIDPRSTMIQTEDAVWIFNGESVQVDISNSPEGVHRAWTSLSDEESVFVTGGRVLLGGE